MKTRLSSSSSVVIFQLCLYFACSVLSACGGGGSGGGSTGESGSGNDSSYGVRVLHSSVDAAPVDLTSSSNSEALVSQQFFAGDKGYRALPDKPQILSLTTTLNPAQVIATFSVTANSKSRYSILLFGDLQNLGLRTRLIEDKVPDDISDSAIRVVNGVAGAAALQVSISSAASLQLLGYGQNSEYISVPTGEVQIAARRSADGSSAGSLIVNAEAGRAYTVLFAGEAGFYTKAVLFTDR